jgi:hypothetical protein
MIVVMIGILVAFFLSYSAQRACHRAIAQKQQVNSFRAEKIAKPDKAREKNAAKACSGRSPGSAVGYI